MKRLIFIIIVLLFLVIPSIGESITLDHIANLPSYLSESSGIIIDNYGEFWTHNDGGGETAIYKLSTGGSLLRTLYITNAPNIDWEDIARGEDGSVYIGDMGNNSNSRTNLRILKIPSPESLSSDSTECEIIYFDYPEQTAFPPSATERDYDCEAMLAYGDSIYLFTKCRRDPFDGISKLYSLPNTAGTYDAHLIDSFFCSTDFPDYSGQVTAADISPDNSLVAIMTYLDLIFFSDFDGTNFFSGYSLEIDINGLTPTQKEALSFHTNDSIFITDEYSELYGIPFGQKIYYGDLSSYALAIDESFKAIAGNNISVYPNPVRDNCFISVPKGAGITITNILGKTYYSRPSQTVYTNREHYEMLELDLSSEFTPGVYLVRAVYDNHVYTKRLVISQ